MKRDSGDQSVGGNRDNCSDGLDGHFYNSD